YSLLRTTGRLGYLARGVVHLSLVAVHVYSVIFSEPLEPFGTNRGTPKVDQKYPHAGSSILYCESFTAASHLRQSKNKKALSSNSRNDNPCLKAKRQIDSLDRGCRLALFLNWITQNTQTASHTMEWNMEEQTERLKLPIVEVETSPSNHS